MRFGGIECVVGRGILPKLDIQFCDIVVPVISDLEKEAILETGEGGREIVYHYDKVCDPLYEARTNREFESAILTALGEDPAGMYPLSEEQKLYNIMAGTTVICDDGVTYEPLLTITQEDIDAMGVEGQPQQGRITLQEFKEKGVYQVERKQGDFPYLMYNTHYPRFGNGVYGNTKSLGEAFATPVFMGEKVAKENGIATGDTVLVESPHGSVLRIACVSPTYMDDVLALPNGGWSQFNEEGIDVMGTTAA